MPEGTLQLEHLQQATKLLQLKKATIADIEIIFDICWMLTPTQIQKLINVGSLILHELMIAILYCRLRTTNQSRNPESCRGSGDGGWWK